MKRILSMMLAAAMVFSLGVPAFASEQEGEFPEDWIYETEPIYEAEYVPDTETENDGAPGYGEEVAFEETPVHEGEPDYEIDPGYEREVYFEEEATEETEQPWGEDAVYETTLPDETESADDEFIEEWIYESESISETKTETGQKEIDKSEEAEKFALKEAIEVFLNGTGVPYYTVIEAETIGENLTIPENFEVIVGENGVLSIDSGIVLTVKGTLSVQEQGNSTILNNGSIVISETGTVTIPEQKLQGNSIEYLKVVTEETSLAASNAVNKYGTLGDLTWEIDDNGVLTISGTGNMINSEGKAWRLYKESVTSIVIKEGVTSIYNDAFSNFTALENAEIPSSVTKIGGNIFHGCSVLKKVRINSDNTSIGVGCFQKCNFLQSAGPVGSGFDIEFAWTDTIPMNAFTYAENLQRVVLPSTLTTIGADAFGYTGLSAITIPEGVVSVGGAAFEHCNALKEVSLPSSLTRIGRGSFTNCKNLMTITLPNGLQTIGDDAFSHCDALESIDIPDSVVSLGSNVFFSSSALKNVVIRGPITSLNSTFWRCEALEEVTIPASVTKIGAYTFGECESLKRVIFQGTESQWKSILETLGNNNDILMSPDVDIIFGGIVWKETPQLQSIINTTEGVQISWQGSDENRLYRVFRKEGSGSWGLIGETSSLTFTDITAVSGSSYSYTVCCIDDEYHVVSEYDNDGLSITYIAAPILKVVATMNGGVGVAWENSEGAEKYRVYRKTETSKWTKIADTTGDILPMNLPQLGHSGYFDTTVESGVTYFYTVRCINNEGKTISGYDTTGLKIKYVASPKLSAVSAVNGGVKVSWKASDGAAKYRVFRKAGGDGWSKVGDTTALNYTDKTVTSGTTYSYTVRCLNSAGKHVSAYDTEGLSIKYVAAPELSTITLATSGVKITWKGSAGAEKYRVYRKEGSGSWSKVGDTTGTSYTDKTALSGTTYSYTVRCISAEGKTTSAYNKTGLSITYIAAPVLSSVKAVTGGVKVTWKASTGAEKYRVFRKTGSGSWTKLGDTTKLSYTDKTVKGGTTYSYTVRCINSTGKSYTSAYNKTGKSITVK